MRQRDRIAIPWHRRLEARVAVALALLVAGALGALLFITTRLVASQSRGRAGDELAVARTAFSSLLDNRAASAIAITNLVTELPVFRAHLTDARLAADRPTVGAMVDGYRRQLEADFAIVTNGEGEWLASPGWEGAVAVAAPLRDLVTDATHGTSGVDVIVRQQQLYLVVSVPARFMDEVLGTLTVGYHLTDALAKTLARLAQCEVVLISDGHAAAMSLARRAAGDAGSLAQEASSVAFGVLPGVRDVGGHDFVAAVFPRRAAGRSTEAGRILLLSDWEPTQAFIDRLRRRFLLGSLAVFAVAIVGGGMFSRRISRPLRDVVRAASDIARGNLALQLPVQGDGEAQTMAMAFNEMSTSLQAAHERLVHDAIHDHLTRLPNRVLFMERLARSMAQRLRHPQYRFAVLFIDLDRFKHVNDSLGHPVGDELLLAFAERLSGVVRQYDIVSRAAGKHEGTADANTVARFGGDEFIVLLDDLSDPVDAVRVAERIQMLGMQALPVKGEEMFVTPSIGVAVCSDDHHSGDEVVRDADLAMYRAKSAGGGQFAVYDVTMHEEALQRLRLETELRHAVERREFRLWYQPIVALPEGRLVGVEALVRWRHPERGLLAPAAFLSVAEELGIIRYIDEWALVEACRQGEEWRRLRADCRDLTMSVNLSAMAFASDSLVAQVKNALRISGFPAEALRLEVTESVAIAEPARVRRVLKALRELGVRVSLDDFGTGYCSLSYLQQFPVDTLKIDRSFVARIGDPDGPEEIIRLLIGLARTLGLDVVAEGIETEGQLRYLSQLGCSYGQGYYFARPASADDLTMLDGVSSQTCEPS